jgi:hypothetical protein
MPKLKSNFCPVVLSDGRFVATDVLSPRTFCPRMFCLRTFCLRTFCLSTVETLDLFNFQIEIRDICIRKYTYSILHVCMQDQCIYIYICIYCSSIYMNTYLYIYKYLPRRGNFDTTFEFMRTSSKELSSPYF